MYQNNPDFDTDPLLEKVEQTIATAPAPKQVLIKASGVRETSYTNSFLNITHTEHWDKKEGDTIPGSTVSDFIDQMWNRLKFANGTNFLEKGGPFNGYQVHTWHKSRVAEGGVSGAAGLTTHLYTKINGNYLFDSGYTSTPQMLGGIYSHEFGHNYHMACGMAFDGTANFFPNTDVAKGFVDNYRRMRGKDFRPNTNEVERLAEDYKYFFGTDGIANKPNPNDDAAQPGSTVRWAKDIVGLKEFIQGLWPVFQWLKDKQIKNFEYLDTKKYFKWERLVDKGATRWEAFSDGTFFRWNGFKWMPFNTKSTINLEGNWEKWKSTGVNVVKGESITISASGIITFFVGGNYPFTPAGEAGKIAGNGAPAPGLTANSLVVKTGGSPVYVGNGKTITADATTELLIAANDDFFPDNGGFWTVNINV